MPSQSPQQLINDLRNARSLFRPDWPKRIAAAQALGAQRAVEAVNDLAAVVKENQNADLVRAASEALRLIKGSAEAAPPMQAPAAPEVPPVFPSGGATVTLAVAGSDSRGSQALRDAVATAPDGATLKLPAGTYLLDKPLVVSQSIRIVGSGRDATRIVYEGGGSVLRCEGKGTCAALALTFEHRGLLPGSVVDVQCEAIDLRDCCFTGGVIGGDSGGDGLYLKNEARGVVVGCIFTANSGVGICIDDQATPLLQDNTCSENHEGIRYIGESGGSAHRNRCSNNQIGIHIYRESHPTIVENRCESNKMEGIAISDDALPVLEGNLCSSNALHGIYYGTSKAGGVARRNRCTGNGRVGIWLTESAQPRLEDNRCEKNSQSGIAYTAGTGGICVSNTCAANSGHGIELQDDAQPTIEKNICKNNSSGIVYADHAGGVARGNACTGNQNNGIQVGDEARPSVESNTCDANGGCGLLYTDAASGSATGNTCSRNQKGGIVLVDEAHPALQNNRCLENVASGITYADNATGSAHSNECVGNAMHGILVVGQASPTLEHNSCSDNEKCGIILMEGAGGVVRANRCTDNGAGILHLPTFPGTIADNLCIGNQAANLKVMNEEKPQSLGQQRLETTILLVVSQEHFKKEVTDMISQNDFAGAIIKLTELIDKATPLVEEALDENAHEFARNFLPLGPILTEAMLLRAAASTELVRCDSKAPRDTLMRVARDDVETVMALPDDWLRPNAQLLTEVRSRLRI